MHLACAHKSNDSRILVKECCSLAKAGYEVVYYTSINSYVNEPENDLVKIKFHSLDIRGMALNRQVVQSIIARKENRKKIIQIVEQEKPDVLHIHEMELMYMAGKIKKKFPHIQILYDVHEDNAEQYACDLRKVFGKKIGNLFKSIIEKFDMHYVSQADGVITVTPYLLKKLSNYNTNIIEIRNMPSDIEESKSNISGREAMVCYCGGVTEERGISTLFAIAPDVRGQIFIAGPLSAHYSDVLKTRYPNIWGGKVQYLGYLDRENVNELYSHAVAGMCTLKYNKNIYNAFPIKLFEYMAAGIPVICSDFPLWKKIIEEERCGITVDPEDEKEILRAINLLLDNREMAQQMADRGKKAVQDKYNWKLEEKKLLKFYQNFKGFSSQQGCR